MRKARDLKQVRVSVRPASAEDKGPVVEFCKKIWGGHDYLPEVWDEWLKDGQARLLVATVNTMPVGVAHAHFQDKSTAWLEGVRVNPKYRGHGIAGQLNRELFNWSRKKGAKVARLCTGRDNTASQNHLLKTGFKPIQTFERFTSTRPLKLRPDGTKQVRRYTRSSWKELAESPMFDEYKEMYADGWTWYPLTPRSLKKLTTEKRVLKSENRNGQTGFAVVVPDHRGVTLGLATGSKAQVTASARYTRYLLRAKSPGRRVRALVPRASVLENSLKEAGFKKTGATIVYEKRISSH